MEQLINGRFEYEAPKLSLSASEISLETKVGENCRGELFFGAADHRRIKGMVMSSNRRLLLAKDKFSGTDICIPYGVDVKGLKPGDRLDTILTINSNLGEYQVPVHVQVTKSQIRTSQGEIHSLNEFVRLAQKDYREAFRLYTSDTFGEILTGADRKYRNLYDSMSQNPVTYQNMEEFLIAADKKEPVKLQLDKEFKDLGGIESTLKDTLYLYKSNWGYANMEVEVCGDFLEVEKKVITSDDFIGSVYGLEYLIRRERLGKGRKYGQIRIHTVYGTLVYEVGASGNAEYTISTRSMEKKVTLTLCKLCEQFRLGEISKEDWKTAVDKKLKELKDLGCYYVRHQLLEAYVYVRIGDFPQALSALWPLKDLAFTREQQEEEAVYLALSYKCGGLDPEKYMELTDKLEMAWRMNPGSWVLLKALMETSEEYRCAPAKRLYRMDEMFQLGCRSPFMYLDAYELIREDENQLKKLSPFMVQVLSYAASHGLLTESLTLRIGHLSEYVKSFQPLIYRLLEDCYEAYPQRNLVDSICKYIMKGQPRNRWYFRWYALAVEEDIRLTRLYEYYIETMPESNDGVLPQVIRMYFVYNNALSNKKRALVYANVIRNKEKDRTTYQSYRKAMEQFAAESLAVGRINADYAVIYQECIEKIDSVAMGEAVAGVMFTYRIYCDDPKIRDVIVRHGELEGEQRCPLKDGVAYVNLYTPEAQILFEDGKHRRYAATVDYNMQKLMEEKEYLKRCIALDVRHPGMILHVCYGKSDVRVRTLGCFQHAAQMKAFRKDYRQAICRKILEYYAAHAGDDTLDGYLKQIDYMTFAQVDKVLLVEILINKGMYDKAYEILCEYGYEGVRPESLMKLASRMILKTNLIEQEELLYLSLYVYEEGKYDEVILHYLSDNLLGPVAQMEVLWERMKGFQLDTYALEEKIFLLAMFGRVHLKQGHEILKSYIHHQGKMQVILAWLSYCSYDYFLGDRQVDDSIFTWLERCYVKNWEMDLICHLALLKYYTTLSAYTEVQEKLIEEILEECNEAGLRFAFFGRLASCYTKPLQLDDKQIVEVRYAPGAKVTIYYRIYSGDHEDMAYTSEPLRDMYRGIFVKEFLLFYGETLEYYFAVEQEGKTEQTEVVTLLMEDSFGTGASRYQLLNQMLAARKLSQDGRMEKLIEEYLRREKLTEKLFPLMK